MAQRLTTHGTTCVSVTYQTVASDNSAASAYGMPSCTAVTPAVLVCGTNCNSIARFDPATPACLGQHIKGPKRYSCAFTPCLSHVAVYGDPTAPAIELQLENHTKFAHLEGHKGVFRACAC